MTIFICLQRPFLIGRTGGSSGYVLLYINLKTSYQSKDHLTSHSEYSIQKKSDVFVLFLNKLLKITWRCGSTWYSGTCLIRHTKGPVKCVGIYRMLVYSGFILEILWDNQFLSDCTSSTVYTSMQFILVIKKLAVTCL